MYHITPWQPHQDTTPLITLIRQVQEIEFAMELGADYWHPLQQPADYFHGGGFFVAHHKSELIGCLGLLPLAPGIAEIKRMIIASSHRGQGIAAQLLQTALAHPGFDQIYLGTGNLKPRAIAFYQKWGFHEIPRQGLPPCFTPSPQDDRFFQYEKAPQLNTTLQTNV